MASGQKNSVGSYDYEEAGQLCSAERISQKIPRSMDMPAHTPAAWPGRGEWVGRNRFAAGGTEVLRRL